MKTLLQPFLETVVSGATAGEATTDSTCGLVGLTIFRRYALGLSQVLAMGIGLPFRKKPGIKSTHGF